MTTSLSKSSTRPDTGFQVRRHAWSLDHVHGRMPLGDAAQYGRTVGPAGERIAWLDTETTGLAGGTGTYVFLIGLATIDDGQFVLTQYFLSHLAHEAALLEAILHDLCRYDALVTFNGTRFDLPLLQTRFLLSRMRPTFDREAHLDLMTLARRLWYRRLGGYSMGLLEQLVLGVERFVDVPGWQIPSLYVQYLHTGDLDAIEPVFAHNASDLLSLLALHGLAGEMLLRPEGIRVVVDWSGLARLLEARSDIDAAVRCYQIALCDEHDSSVRTRTVTALGRIYRRRGLVQDLLALWEGELAMRVLPRWLALERLAMIWEWQCHDPARALGMTDEALASLNGGDPLHRERLVHRRERLRRRVSG
ncbi:MAG TPA: ribonuclease H-like domain-containing protein [bacterium]|jgi:hypothetical protein